MRDMPMLRAGLSVVYFASLILLGIGTWLIRLSDSDLARWGPFVIALAHFVREHSWLGPVLPGVAAAAKLWRERLTRVWLLKLVKSLLSDYCDEIFSGQAGAKDCHRVTLFAYRKFAFWGTRPWTRRRHPWSGWLVPVARSGHATQKVRARFLAPDRASDAEGIAGKAWRHRSMATVTGLPELSSASAPDDIKTYCERTLISEKWATTRLVDGETLPRALRAAPVEVSNHLWGVVVLDSIDPNAFDADPTGTIFSTRVFFSTIGRLLEKEKASL